MKTAEEQFKADVAWLSSTPQGRRILHVLFEKTGVWRQLPIGEHADWYSGRHSVGMEFLAPMVSDHAERLVSLLAEARQVSDARRRDAPDTDDDSAVFAA